MKTFLSFGLLVCAVTLSSCMHEEEEESSWWCGYYNSCHHEGNAMCEFYGNCPDKGSVWGSAGSDANSTHVGGMENTDSTHH